jgi:hypothetical protein
MHREEIGFLEWQQSLVDSSDPLPQNEQEHTIRVVPVP